MRRYRGSEGYWAWLLHRVSGLAVLAFLILHILDIALMGLGREAFDALLGFYSHPAFRVGEVLVFAGVLYHALNGLRIILVDFWDGAFGVQRQLWYGVVGLSVVLMVPITYRMMAPVFGA